MDIGTELENFFKPAESEVASVFEREDKAVVVRTEQVYHEAKNIMAKIVKTVESSPEGESVTAFVGRLKSEFK